MKKRIMLAEDEGVIAEDIKRILDRNVYSLAELIPYSLKFSGIFQKDILTMA